MDELLTRQMPHSLEAEQAVIGSMLIDPSCIADMLELVRPDDFYLQQNKDIFTTIYTMFNYSADIDPVTVMDQMKQAGISVDKKKIVQDEPIKSFGDFSLKAKLGYEIVATISVHVSEG